METPFNRCNAVCNVVCNGKVTPLRVLRVAGFFAVALLLMVTLVACSGGGGGGGGGGTPDPPTTNPPTTMTTNPSMTMVPSPSVTMAPNPSVTMAPNPPTTMAPNPPPTTMAPTPAPTPPEPDPPGSTLTFPPDPADFDRQVTTYATTYEYSPSYFLIGGAEYTDQHLPKIKAAYAYVRGATGKDVTITIFDDGIYTGHNEFAGVGKLTVRQLIQGYNPVGNDLSHGTAVAAAAAAARSNADDYRVLNMQGVAFDASIDFVPLDLAYLDEADTDLKRALLFHELLTFSRGDILNFSWGIPGAVTYTPAQIRAILDKTAYALAQHGVDDADKKIIAWAAGNDGYNRPGLLVGLGADFPELRNIIVAVVALDQDGNIWDDSNHCGVSKDNCIAAPGVDILSALYAYGEPGDPLPGPTDYGQVTGTSFAAPIVAGSLAVMKQFFRNQLGNTELVERLFATADRAGKYADADIYGHGVVDLDNATKPQGIITAGMPDDDDAIPLSQTGFDLNGDAFGASFADLDNIEIAGFDELGAPFFFPAHLIIDHAARDATPPPTKLTAAMPDGELALRVDGNRLTQSGYVQQGNWVLGYAENPGQFFGTARLQYGGDSALLRDTFNNAFNFADTVNVNVDLGFANENAFVSPYLSLAQHGTSAGWRHSGGRFGFALMHGNAHFDQWQNPGGERGLGVLLDWTTRTRQGAFAIQAGAVREADSLLGARANDGDLNASTLFAGINIARAFGDWQTLATAYFGDTDSTAHNARWQLDDTIKSGAFALGATRHSLHRRHDTLAIRLTQPLRVDRAKAKMNMPIGRTKHGEVIHRQHHIDLSPHGRTLQLEAAYRMPLNGKGAGKSTLKTAIGVERHPMHDDSRGDNWYARVAVMRRF